MSGLARAAAAVVAVSLGTAALVRRRRRIALGGRRVLITGGSRGLGLTLARQLAARGAILTLVARDKAELAEAFAELPGETHAIAADLADRDRVAAVVREAADKMGGLDILINNAGIIEVGPEEHQELDDFESAMALHFWAPLVATRAALPYLQGRGGRVVNIASVGGQVAIPHLASYAASKFALVGLSNALRSELRRRGVYVTTVSPGLMRTGSHVQATFVGQRSKEYGWFTVGAALPGAAVSAERAAAQILRACENGDPSLTIGLPARLLIVAEALFPTLVAEASALAAAAMPDPSGSGGDEPRPGHAVADPTPDFATRRVDREVERHNEGENGAREATRKPEDTEPRSS